MKEEFESPKMEINLFQKGNVMREKGDIFARQDLLNDDNESTIPKDWE